MYKNTHHISLVNSHHKSISMSLSFLYFEEIKNIGSDGDCVLL